MPPLKPNWRFICRHPAHFLAFGFGSGLARKAPGTCGTLIAYPLFWLWHQYSVSSLGLILLCIVLFILGIWVCNMTERALGIRDHHGIVWDEIVAMLLVLALSPPTLGYWLAAFVLFRLFDIIKPWPIRWVDHHLSGGLGVMLDDLMAALLALLVLRGYWMGAIYIKYFE